MRRKRPIWGMRKHQVVATQTYLVSFWEKNQLLGICTTMRIIKNLNCSTNACFLSFQSHPIHLGAEQALAHYFQLVIFFWPLTRLDPQTETIPVRKTRPSSASSGSLHTSAQFPKFQVKALYMTCIQDFKESSRLAFQE
jgi:hypothetical protein